MTRGRHAKIQCTKRSRQPLVREEKLIKLPLLVSLILTSSPICGSRSDYFGCWSETDVALASSPSEDVALLLKSFMGLEREEAPGENA